jgi:Na+/phosphate symporter
MDVIDKIEKEIDNYVLSIKEGRLNKDNKKILTLKGNLNTVFDLNRKHEIESEIESRWLKNSWSSVSLSLNEGVFEIEAIWE